MIDELVSKYKENAARLLRSPDDPKALLEAFALLSNNSARTTAEQYLPIARRAYELAPNEPNTIFNYASALARTGRNAEAILLYQRTFEIGDPNWKADALYHIGLAFRCLGHNDQAIRYYGTAVELDPENYQAQQDIALATMAAGRLNEGLRLFEVRHKLAAIKQEKNGHQKSTYHRLPEGVRHWQGEDLTNKTITVFHEEGAGDFIQFCRFIPRLKAKQIYLAGPSGDLLDMVAHDVGVDGFTRLEAPDSDFVVGSMTLPWVTGVEYSDVSGAPYLTADPKPLPRRSKLNVGLVWRGSSAYANDDHRSMPFTGLCPLFDLPNVAFYSLQKDEAAREVSRAGFDGFVADLEPFLTDWSATASAIMALDAVVTVDTAVSHLAGALGKPVYIMVTECCDWRWNRDSELTPWYQSARVIRQQKQDDWAPCVERVRELLKAM